MWIVVCSEDIGYVPENPEEDTMLLDWGPPEEIEMQQNGQLRE